MPEHLYIRSLVLGPVDTNCYIVADPTSLDAIIIDPAGNPNAIADIISDDRLVVRGIVNTHGHIDHISANSAMKARFDCPIMIHKLDANALTNPRISLASMLGYVDPPSPPADRLLADGDNLSVGALSFKVIHTPGHTPGGICLLTDGILFSGDTLFAGSVGRTDLPGGYQDHLLDAIRTKLLVLPDDTIVYPGHGPETTIGYERVDNPWL